MRYSIYYVNSCNSKSVACPFCFPLWMLYDNLVILYIFTLNYREIFIFVLFCPRCKSAGSAVSRRLLCSRTFQLDWASLTALPFCDCKKNAFACHEGEFTGRGETEIQYRANCLCISSHHYTHKKTNVFSPFIYLIFNLLLKQKH